MKPVMKKYQLGALTMPPTRGHDLKQISLPCITSAMDAPHTGARLETSSETT